MKLPLLASAHYHTIYRWPFLTKRNYVGLGPMSLEKGDVVCLLQGAKSPIGFRPSAGGDSNRTYRLVGQAYVHGLMRGEASTSREWEKIMLE